MKVKLNILHILFFSLILFYGNILYAQANKELIPIESPNLSKIENKKYYDDSKRGWYWYEVKPEKTKKEEK